MEYWYHGGFRVIESQLSSKILAAGKSFEKTPQFGCAINPETRSRGCRR